MALFIVTGGAGFIGSYLVKALIDRGDRVRILDNLSTGKKENLHPEAEFHKADIRNLDEIQPIFEGVDGVFHTAALPRVQISIQQPLETHGHNINGTLNVLLAAKEAGVKRLIYSASSSAYGDQNTLPLHEEMKPNPKSPYGLQKYLGEEYAKLASLLWNLETVSLRYFNVFGPQMATEGAYTTVISVFNRQKLNNKPLTITGDGTQTRDFTYIDDVIRANLRAMDGAKVGGGEVINIGNSDNHSINEIADLIGSEKIYVEPRLEPHDTLADITKAKNLLGWKPQVPFNEAVGITNKWFEDNAHKFIPDEHI